MEVYLVVKKWHPLSGERSIYFRTTCCRCNEIRSPETLHFVIEKTPHLHARHIGKLQVFCETCLHEVETVLEFDRKAIDLSYEEIRDLLARYNLVLMSHGQDLFLDFMICVTNYRSDVRFQSY